MTKVINALTKCTPMAVTVGRGLLFCELSSIDSSANQFTQMIITHMCHQSTA